VNGLPINFSVSIGVTSIFDRNENIDVLLDRADKALYIAKNAGRNQVHVIKPLNQFAET
jgi:diguanylate cyclase (GGDEF)-like protein